MTLTEFAVIGFGLFAGYWVVSRFFFKPPKPTPEPPPVAPPRDSPSWHEILEVGPSANEAEIRAAYHRLISLYHPDKVESLGPELKALAVAKSQAINAAYREALQHHGAAS